MSENSLYIKSLFRTLFEHCSTLINIEECHPDDREHSFISNLGGLANDHLEEEAFYEKGQQLIESIIANFPMITPALNRDILWLLGGNCMHYLGDDEISLYQQIDELLYQAANENKTLSFPEAKAQTLKLH